MTEQRTAATPWGVVARLVLAATVGISVIVLAFTWTSVTAKPQNIPVSITGPSAQVDAASSALDEQSEGRIVLTTVDDRAAAVDLIESRDSLGAIVLGSSPEVLVASAASPAVSQLLTAAAGQLEQGANAAAHAQAAAAGVEAPHITVAVTDVVPLASTDERGSGIAASAFPLVIAGFIGGLVIALLVRGRSQRLVALAAFSVVIGAALALILQSWLGVLQGSFGVNLLALSLIVASISAFIVGAHSLLGRPGLPVAIVTVMLIANPISAAALPWQFLPEPWGLVGQWFQPGAGATLLRDLSYFPNAASIGFAWAVLAVWAVVGFALVAVGSRGGRALPAAAAPAA
jgi:hypothetical protein